MRWLIVAVLLILTTNSAADDAKLAALFKQHKAVGTIVIEALNGDHRYVHNAERVEQRFSPASTFKIPNSLIAIEQDVVDSKSEVFIWDGNRRGLEAWNANHSLSSAFRVSCVWCYQEIARKLSHSYYEKVLKTFGYGNAQTGAQLDRFWLDGSLAISAQEQIDFLRKLVNDDLPVSSETRNSIVAMMLTDESAYPHLYAKSGWAAGEINVGWYVGFLITQSEDENRVDNMSTPQSNDGESNTWLFALNIDMHEIDQAPLRRQLVVGSLKALELMP